MTYQEFIQDVKNWLASTSGLTYIKECLEDEIELPINETGINQFPAAFITPIPFTINDYNNNTYSCRIYLAGDVGLSPVMNPTATTISKRFQTYSSLINIFQKFIQLIPDEFNGLQFPITATPILLWDANIDGIYWDINMITSINCLI